MPVEVAELVGRVRIDPGDSERTLLALERGMFEGARQARALGDSVDRAGSQAQAFDRRLDDVGQALNQVRQSMQGSGQATARNSYEMANFETRLRDLRARLSDTNRQFQAGEITNRAYIQTITRLNSDGVDLANALRRMNATLADSGGSAEEGASAFEDFAGAIGFSVDPIEFAKNALVTATAAAIGLGVAITSISIDLGGEFNGTLAMLAAQTNANGQQLDALRRRALELGADKSIPQFANDAAEAMLELAKGGLTIEQSMDAARGALMLAAAAEIDAAQAAEYISDAINVFGLKASQAVWVADLLAATSNAASGDIGDFGLALQQVGAIAAQANIPIEDTLTLLGLMAKNGIKSSDAGTSVKSMLMGIRGPSDEAAQRLKKLGIEVFDAAGKMKTARQIVSELATAFDGLTDKQVGEEMAKIFGSDGGRAAAIFIKEAAAGFDDMKTKVKETGVSAKLTEAQMKGVGGAWIIIQKQGTNAAISLYDSFSGSLEKILRSFGDTFGKLGEYFGEQTEAGRELRAIVSQIGVDMEKFAAGAIDLFDLDNPEQIKKDLQDILNLVRFTLDIAGGVVMILGYVKQGYNAFRDWVDSAGTLGRIIEGYVNPIRRWTSLWSESLGYAKETTMEMERQRQIALIAEAEKLRKQQAEANLRQSVKDSGFDKQMEEFAEKQNKKRSLNLDEKKKGDNPFADLQGELTRELGRLTDATRESEVAAKLQEDAYKGLNATQRETILNLARQIDAQKQIAPLQKAQAEAAKLLLEQDAFDFQKMLDEKKAKNEDALRQGMVSLTEYYTLKRTLEETEHNRSIKLLQDQQKAAEAAVSQAQKDGKPDARVKELENEVTRLKQEINKRQYDFKKTSSQAAAADAESVRLLNQEYADLNRQLLEMTGAWGLKDEITAINAELAELAKKFSGLPGLAQLLERLGKVRIGRATQEDQGRRIDLTNQGFETERQRVANDVALGLKTELDARGELNDLVRRQREFLLQAAEAALRLAETEKDPARRQAILDQVEGYRRQAAELRTLAEQAAKEFRDQFKQHTKDLFKELFQGNWREGLAGFFNGIADDLLERASNMFSDLVTNILWGEDGQSGLLGGLMKGLTDFLSKIFTSFFGGFFAEGGDFGPGRPIMVGEKGPEMILPRQPGRVISNSDLQSMLGASGGQSGNTIYYNQTLQIDGKRPLSRESRRQISSGVQQGLERAARAD